MDVFEPVILHLSLVRPRKQASASVRHQMRQTSAATAQESVIFHVFTIICFALPCFHDTFFWQGIIWWIHIVCLYYILYIRYVWFCMIRIFINNKKEPLLKAPISVDWPLWLRTHVSSNWTERFQRFLGRLEVVFFWVSLYRVDLDTIVLYEDMLFDVIICIYLSFVVLNHYIGWWMLFHFVDYVKRDVT